MIQPLAVTLLVATAALALFGLVTTLLGRPAERPHVIAVRLVEALLVAQALLGLIKLAAGLRPPETSTFAIYLLVSVCLLPLGLQFARAEPTRWGGAVIAVASIAVGVVVLRLVGLWAGAHA